MAKKKKGKARNPVAQAMITHNSGAGLHIDQKKEQNKNHCKEKIEPEDF